MANQAALKLYPRGFLGATLNARIEQKQRMVETANGWFTSQVPTLRDQNTFDSFNVDVETLHNEYIFEHTRTTAFDFRRRILQAALTAFGTLNFDVWVLAQYQSPSAGDLHGRFIVDTIRFLNTGRRDMSLETWNSLLVAPQGPDHIGPVPDTVKDFFGIQSGGPARWHCSLTEVIALWCSQPNGLEDLLCTLQVLFGDPNH